jgi:hypothetical protein
LANRYGDYEPTLASEVLARGDAIGINRETLRQWMSAEKLWKPRRRHRAELAQWDTSEHQWLEGRGPKLYLIAMIYDATSELTGRFSLSHSTAEAVQAAGPLRGAARLGPAAVYTRQGGAVSGEPASTKTSI